MKQSEKIDFIYQWVLQESVPSPKAIERGMSLVRAYSILRALAAAIDKNNPWDCLEIWSELNDAQQAWVTSNLDRPHIERLGECLAAARDQAEQEIGIYTK